MAGELGISIRMRVWFPGRVHRVYTLVMFSSFPAIPISLPLICVLYAKVSQYHTALIITHGAVGRALCWYHSEKQCRMVKMKGEKFE